MSGITAAGNGIQLEQPAGVRTVKEQRDAIARLGMRETAYS